ncbi:MAG: hypothetical protein V3W37_08770 [Candidatus Binatia bacterium]
MEKRRTVEYHLTNLEPFFNRSLFNSENDPSLFCTALVGHRRCQAIGSDIILLKVAPKGRPHRFRNTENPLKSSGYSLASILL